MGEYRAGQPFVLPELDERRRRNIAVVEALTKYLANCPLVTDNLLVEFDISPNPTNNLLYPHMDGGVRCRYPFTISSANNFTPDDAKALAKTGMYEALANWLRGQTRLRNFPALPFGFTARSIKAVGYEYKYQPDIDAGKYVIYCDLEYYKKSVNK